MSVRQIPSSTTAVARRAIRQKENSAPKLRCVVDLYRAVVCFACTLPPRVAEVRRSIANSVGNDADPFSAIMSRSGMSRVRVVQSYVVELCEMAWNFCASEALARNLRYSVP